MVDSNRSIDNFLLIDGQKVDFFESSVSTTTKLPGGYSSNHSPATLE
jgi:hypothetical protein